MFLCLSYFERHGKCQNYCPFFLDLHRNHVFSTLALIVFRQDYDCIQTRLPCITMPCIVCPGNRGDESYLIDAGVHVFMSRHHQREGQGRAQDLLRSHGDDPIPVTGDCDALNISHTQTQFMDLKACTDTQTHTDTSSIRLYSSIGSVQH